MNNINIDSILKDLSRSSINPPSSSTGVGVLKSDLSIPFVVNHLVLLTKSKFLNILYICMKKNYIYGSDLSIISEGNNKYYLDKLVAAKIIKKCKINTKKMNFVKGQNNINHFNIKQISFYELRPESFEFYNRREIKEIIFNNVDEDVVDYLEELEQTYFLSVQEAAKKNKHKQYNEIVRKLQDGVAISLEERELYNKTLSNGGFNK